MRKAIIVFLFFAINLFGESEISKYLLNIESKYSKDEIYTKIFKYGAFNPDEIDKLKDINFKPTEILIISAIYVNIEESFSEFYRYLKNNKPSINRIIEEYGFTEDEVIGAADEIIKTEIDKNDYYEFKEYGKKIFYNIEAGGELSYQFSNYEYSFYASAGLYLIPIDIISISLYWTLEYLPVENIDNVYAFSIKNNTIDFGGGIYLI